MKKMELPELDFVALFAGDVIATSEECLTYCSEDYECRDYSCTEDCEKDCLVNCEQEGI